jgi:hypothetical protein
MTWLDPGTLIGSWPLTGDFADEGPHGLHGVAVGEVDSTPNGTRFAGGHVRVATSPRMDAGGALTVAAWVRLPKVRRAVAGDVLSRFDPARRRGFNLWFADGSVIGSQSNTRNVAFGIDDGSDPRWEDVGRPGDAVYVAALAVHDGHLYAGTYEAGLTSVGRVYRLEEGRWTDTGAPVHANAVTALAVHDGALFAGTTFMRAGGSALPDSENTTPGGDVLRFDGATWWTSTGKVGATDSIGALVSFDGDLFAMSSYSQGVFRLGDGQGWRSAGSPGRRLLALGIHRGGLYGAGNDHASVEDAIAKTRAGIVVEARSTEGGGGMFRWENGTAWRSLGMQPDTTQVYSIGVHDGDLWIGTWPNGLVFQGVGDGWDLRGRLGDETEVMGMVTYNGTLYGGTLPHAEVHRYESHSRWTRIGVLDETPDVMYRRAASMAVFSGRLYVGTLPSGSVRAMRTGRAVSLDRAYPSGWHHLAAVRSGDVVSLHLDGMLVATDPADPAGQGDGLDDALGAGVDLLIGGGRQDGLQGWMRDVVMVRAALDAAAIGRLASDRPPEPTHDD